MRSVPEWVGNSDDTPIPPRVRLRVYARDGGCCQCGCGRRIAAGESWQTDHATALVNGGANRETNLRTLITAHHAAKTAADVAEKAKTYDTRAKHLGLKRRRGRPMPGGRDSGLKIRMDGTVVDRVTGQPIRRAA